MFLWPQHYIVTWATCMCCACEDWWQDKLWSTAREKGNRHCLLAKPLLSPLKNITARSMMKTSTMKLLAKLRMKNLLMDGRTTSNPFWGRHARNSSVPVIVDFVVVELDPWGGVWYCPFFAPHTVAHKFFQPLGNRLFDPQERFYPKCLAQASHNFHFSSALLVSRCKSDLRLQSRRSGRKHLRPIRWRFVMLDNAGYSGICPVWFCEHFSLPSLLRCELRNFFLCLSVFPWRAPWDGPFFIT